MQRTAMIARCCSATCCCSAACSCSSTARAHELPVARILAAAGTDIVRGELDQIDRRRPQCRSMAMHDYLAVVSRKTARFFAACAEGGATLAGAPPRLRTAYRRFGQSLGVAFKMADDIADATGDPRRATKPPRHAAAGGWQKLAAPGCPQFAQAAAVSGPDPARPRRRSTSGCRSAAIARATAPPSTPSSSMRRRCSGHPIGPSIAR
jgi:hypothetical protein